VDTDPSWLLLIYRVPTEPTRLRATVWRRLKALGAVYLQNSAAAFPNGPAAERAMRSLRKEIQQMGGEAHLLHCDVLADQADVAAAFNAARDEEYGEVVDRCQDFLGEIDKELAAEHFTYAELEENDEDLAKLRSWCEKIRARDLLGAAGYAETQHALERCETAMERFATQVYDHERDA
jgi:hypothetical protein